MATAECFECQAGSEVHWGEWHGRLESAWRTGQAVHRRQMGLTCRSATGAQTENAVQMHSAMKTGAAGASNTGARSQKHCKPAHPPKAAQTSTNTLRWKRRQTNHAAEYCGQPSVQVQLLAACASGLKVGCSALWCGTVCYSLFALNSPKVIAYPHFSLVRRKYSLYRENIPSRCASISLCV